MNADQIKHMVDRFLMWPLPRNFTPDNGISYKRPNYAPNVPGPSGTNLFDATQADAMIRHMVEGLPAESPDPTYAAAQKESFIRGEMGMAAADRAQTTLKRPRPEVAALTDAAAMREAAAKVADDSHLTGPTPIGPLFGAGWEAAITHIASTIRALPLPPDTRDGEIAELRDKLEVSEAANKAKTFMIVDLRSAAEKAREVLEPFAYFAKFIRPESEDYDEHRSFSSVNLKCGMFIRARSALAVLRALPLPPDHRESGPKTYGGASNDSINAQTAELAALRSAVATAKEALASAEETIREFVCEIEDGGSITFSREYTQRHREARDRARSALAALNG
jgi:hypothetical protein